MKSLLLLIAILVSSPLFAESFEFDTEQWTAKIAKSKDPAITYKMAEAALKAQPITGNASRQYLMHRMKDEASRELRDAYQKRIKAK